jgi:hypothetical protein
MKIVADDRQECWDPSRREPLPPSRTGRPPLPPERERTGLCGEAQADGVPCTDPACQCERCGRAR